LLHPFYLLHVTVNYSKVYVNICYEHGAV